MRLRTILLALLVLTVAAFAVPRTSHAGAFGLFNTGVDDFDALLANGAIDPHYTLPPPNPDNGNGPNTYVVPDNAFPIPPWVPSSATSKWIGPSPAVSANVLAETYRYTTTVDLTGVDPNSVIIFGLWSGDNNTQDIIVNGTSTGQTGGGFNDLTKIFGLSTILGHPLISGVNTIEFVSDNAGAGANPGGLRIESVGSIQVPAAAAGTVPIPGLFNTGLDAAGNLLGDGGVDGNYTLVGGSPAGPNAIAIPAGFPIGPWIANGLDTRWISPNTGPGNGDGPGGDYEYEISFDMTGLDLSTAVIDGLWSSDNTGADILLNGVSTGNSNTGNFGGLEPFSISAAGGDVFSSGINTLTFKLNNAGAGPTGLRVAGITGSAVPEPSSIILALLGCISLFVYRRRS